MENANIETTQLREIEPETIIPQKTKRSDWIDIAKGLGVFLVFLGHLWYQSNFPILNQMIYSFHIPMFFILSGYVIKRKQEETFKTFISKKFMRLLLPTIIYIILTLPLYFILKTPTSELSAIKRIFFFNGLVAYNDPCWYFIVLFEVYIIERILKIKEQNIYLKTLFMAIFFTIGFLLYHFDVFIPFGLDKAIIALGFVILGMILKESIEKIKMYDKPYYKIIMAIIFFISVGLWVVFGVILNPKISFYSMSLGQYWFFILSGIFGSIWFFILCKAIEKYAKFLITWGKNSIIVIGTHYVFVTAFKKLAGYLGFRYTWIYSVTAIIYTVVIIILYMFLCKVLNKHTPVLVGLPPNKINNKEKENKNVNNTQ